MKKLTDWIILITFLIAGAEVEKASAQTVAKDPAVLRLENAANHHLVLIPVGTKVRIRENGFTVDIKGVVSSITDSSIVIRHLLVIDGKEQPIDHMALLKNISTIYVKDRRRTRGKAHSAVGYTLSVVLFAVVAVVVPIEVTFGLAVVATVFLLVDKGVAYKIGPEWVLQVQHDFPPSDLKLSPK